MKDTIDKYFSCTKGTEYRLVYYNSLNKCGQLPINPRSGEYYNIKHTAEPPQHCNENDLKVLKSINRFYHNVRLFTGERKPKQITEADLVNADTKLMIKALRSRFNSNIEWTELMNKIAILAINLDT